jgi:G3E family GTPase
VTKAPRIPLHIVTGFLGAGKTTLINRLLRSAEMAQTLVIVNEWGEIGLDHLLFEAIADDVILLASGCLCCTLRGDLIDGLHDLLRRRDESAISSFARIVLETSGLADPAPILHALIADPVLAERIEIAGVTTVVDAVNGAATLEAHGEARRQVALADRIALTKIDFTRSPSELARLWPALDEINPAARVLDAASDGFGSREFLAGPIDLSVRARATRMAAHGGSVRARVFTTNEPVGAAALARFLARLDVLLGPRLLRVKGLVATRELPGQPLLIQGAQHALSPPRRLPAWPDASRRSRRGLADCWVDAAPEAVEVRVGGQRVKRENSRAIGGREHLGRDFNRRRFGRGDQPPRGVVSRIENRHTIPRSCNARFPQ